MEMNLQVPIEQLPTGRGEGIIKDVLCHYEFLKSQVKADQSLEFVASVNGHYIKPCSLSPENGNFISLESRTEKGGLVITYAPAECVVFTLTVENKVPTEPPREIGFRPNLERPRLQK